MLRICLIEDEQSLSDMIALNLELEGYQVDRFFNGRLAFESASAIGGYDLVILDVMLPEVSGLDICREIRKYSSTPILFLSAKGTTTDRIAGLKLGANDYLPKPFDLEELLLKVHILTQHALVATPQIDKARIGKKEVNFNTYEVMDTKSGVVTELSRKEIDLLRLFTENEGRVVSRDEILDKIWGKDQFPTSRTIDNYILSFRKIFEKDPKNPAYFHSIRSVGYKFTNPKEG